MAIMINDVDDIDNNCGDKLCHFLNLSIPNSLIIRYHSILEVFYWNKLNRITS